MPSDTTNFINIPITPGGMLGDIVEDELGHHQHQRVENLRQIKKGEWELAPGYRNTFTGLISAKAGIEVDEDVSGDRFRLIQDGINILRVDYNISNSPLFGYENEPTVTLSLPSGVSIGGAVTLRFFQFRGVVRISGASEPLHYSFVDRTVLAGDDSFTIKKWVLEKAGLLHVDNDLEVVETLPIPHVTIDLTVEQTEPSFALFLKFFYEFDNGQYQLLRLPDASLITSTVFGFPEEIFPITAAYGAHIKLRIPGTTLKDNLFNERITGIGIAFATVPYGVGGTDAAELNAVYKEELEPFFARDILRIEAPDNPVKIGFALQAVNWNSGTPTQIEISDPDDTWGGVGLGAVFLPAEAGYLGAGVKVKISLASNSIDTTVSSVTFGDFATTKGILTVADSMAAVFGATGLKFNAGIVVTLEWQYSAVDGYFTYFGLNLLALGPLYEEFAGIPIGTLQNTPNWEAIQFLAERSYISGQTGDKGSEVVSGGSLETVNVAQDTFTDTNGVLLTAHTMNLGNGWNSASVRYEIQTNEATNDGTGADDVAWTELNRSDNIKLTGKFFVSGEGTFVIAFRYVDANNYWFFQFINLSVTFQIELVRVIGGVGSVRASEAHTIAQSVYVTYQVQLAGDVLTVDILTPETHTLTVTDSTHNTGTKAGFRMVTGAAQRRFDDFLVTEDILVPTSQAVANDAFTDTNGVALTAHTMPLGNGWTSAGAQWEIQSNEARDSGTGSGVQVITELNKSDKLIITGKIMVNAAGDESRISFRHFNINDEWFFSYSGSTSPTFEIVRVIASAATVQATQAHTVADGVFVSFQITLDGSSIELKIISPEVYTLTVTDSTHLTETKLAFFPLATNSGVTRIDDLVVVERVSTFLIASEEEDTVRHSAIGQFDNLPIGNVIQTEVGTTDKILNLAKRDDQLTILKARSISTGGFVGAFYNENIGFTKHGLHSVLGVLSVTVTINAEESNEFIFIMDEDDLYIYNGNQIVSFFEKVELRKFYRDNVTTSSFMLFDKLHGEILFFLGTEILVWNMHVPEFYIRKTDITPLYGFLDADNFLVIGNAVKQVTFNHGLGTPYDESMSYFLRSRVTDINTPHRFKKFKEMHTYLTSSEGITITLKDDNNGLSSVVKNIINVFSNDTFTDSDGVLLSDHVMDSGSGWSLPSGNELWTILNNRARRGGGAESGVQTETSQSDGVITGEFAVGQSFGNYVTIDFRYQDANNKWDLYFINLASVNPNRFALRKWVAGVITDVVSIGHTPIIANDVFKSFQINLEGPNIDVTVFDPTRTPTPDYFLSTVDSFNQTLTKHGLFSGGNCLVDDWRFETSAIIAAFKPRIIPNKSLFKELTVEVANTVNSASLTAQIRDFLFKVERWQKI